MSTDKPTLPERLATIKEACIYGKLGRTKIYEKLNSGIIRAFTREGRTLIDLDSIDEMNRALLKPWLPRGQQAAPGELMKAQKETVGLNVGSRLATRQDDKPTLADAGGKKSGSRGSYVDPRDDKPTLVTRP